MENKREPPALQPTANDSPGAGRSGRPLTALAALLRSHRRAAGLTQEDVAGRSGISVRTISDLERGVYRTARKDTARLLAEVLKLQDRRWSTSWPSPEVGRFRHLRRNALALCRPPALSSGGKHWLGQPAIC